VLIRGRVSYAGTMAGLHSESTSVAIQLEQMLAADIYEADDD
jgi:hypothetical protein